MTSKELHNLFAGKKITILGLGLLGRGTGVTAFLARYGAILTVTDLKTKEELKSSLAKLAKYPKITYVLGEHRVEDIIDADMVMRSPDVRYDSPYVLAAEEVSVPVEMDASLFMKLLPDGVKVVGVTGTRGKSTVSYAIAHILEQAKSCKGNVYLAGNVRDGVTLPLLAKVKAGDVVVLELDSWQLQGFGEAKLSPHVAVFTNLMRDHMNYYRGDMKRYAMDKTQIYRNQKKGDVLIISAQAQEALKTYKAPKGKGEVRLGRPLFLSMSTRLPGAHNRLNMGMAAEACRALGVLEKDIVRGVATFPGVHGRLEFLRAVKGVTYYNDNNATCPDATLVALDVFKKEKKSVVLIAGGADKNLDFTTFVRVVPKMTKAIVLLPGTATDMLLPMLKGQTSLPPVAMAGSMKEAVRLARDIAARGDVVLFSPGAASFGIFKNTYDRNDQFVAAIRAFRA
ncbi:MAG: UDP-N-acetylmuramoyl-L-alanine--D-glutamate ligase [Candidatus Yonathbacteria bacterium]|nr:UDP-N-acetylmuramoyl-L-alanine--D-glutamate ligase [Candidatus Yonathbacteria bacterium]